MKAFILLFLNLLIGTSSFAQLLPGTLDVSGFPDLVQPLESLVKEAGMDDLNESFESEFNATEISFVLDASTDPITGVTLTSDANCSENIYRYSVFAHTTDAPPDMTIEAKTYLNSGNRFPASALYDNLPVQPLGPRNLFPENGGTYITIPNTGSAAIKIMEFVGCRQNIPIQYRVRSSVKNSSSSSNLNVFFTVVGSLN